jgi:Cu/Ag efflux pump CusA
MWGTGSEVMSRIAAPMVGGKVSSGVLMSAVHGAEGADPIVDVY